VADQFGQTNREPAHGHAWDWSLIDRNPKVDRSCQCPLDGLGPFGDQAQRINIAGRYSSNVNMLLRSPETDAFWQAFRRYAGLDHDNYVVGSFGDSPEMATELADLVIAGIKRATASLVRDYRGDREPMPQRGDFVMMLDGEGQPRFIWRTTEIKIKPLSEVDEAFARDEGEGDRTRDWWVAAHRRYFARQAAREGFELDDEILTVFERFEVVWPLDVADGINGPTSAST
jgi:uncharacterized protein YhfF